MATTDEIGGVFGELSATSTISMNNARVDEGAGTVQVQVSRSFNTHLQVSFSFVIIGGSAREGEDFSGISFFPGQYVGQGTFLPGVSTASIWIDIIDDTVGEADEIFTVRLFDPIQATIGIADGIVTILDNDGGLGDFTVTSGTAGADRLVGSVGKDSIVGGGGDDTITGGDGGDVLYGNTGNDVLYGNTGNDTMFGGRGIDVLYGGRDADVVYGNLGNDLLYGNLGNDTVYGGQDADTIFGGQGDDLLLGNVGNDSILGNIGNDTLDGGSGDDTLNGGGGADVFRFSSGSGNDVVVDGPTFSPDRDLIYIQTNINGSGISSSADLLARLSNNALGQAVLDLGDGNTITFQSYSSSWFVSGDFVLF